MKKLYYLMLVGMVAVALSSCTTYAYTSRSVKINRVDITATNMLVDVEPNFDVRYTATSDFCRTKSEAVEGARYRVLTENDIDVLVDPIYKVSYTRGRVKKWQATVVTFGAQYVNARPGTEETDLIERLKGIEMEDVIKYNMLQHPQLMHQNRRGDMQGCGDIITINNQAPEAAGSKHEAQVQIEADKAQLTQQNTKLEAEKTAAEQARTKAEVAQQKAEEAQQKAEAAQKQAEEALLRAEREKAQVEVAKAKAETELTIAQKALEEATKAKETAEREAAQAVADKNFAEKVARKAIEEKQECERNQ